MRIKEIISQNRRDFHAIYECEHCGHSYEASGYDDANFHKNVIPAMACPICNKRAGENYHPLTTKYAAGQVV